MKHFKIAALAGDGIGPEVMREAIKVLRATEKKFGFTLAITEAPVGWAGIDAAFLSNRDPLTGHPPAEDYRPLFSKIVLTAPAPIGLGPELR